MGVVYRATHALLRRDTAVKLLLPTRISAASIARFEREVKLTAQLTHPNTVAILDYGRTPDGVFYYAMEYLEGGDLEQAISYSGVLPPGRVIWILNQVCSALAEAHDLGLVHRDIKPSNVILCERGRDGDIAKLLDFGLVKDLNAADGGLTHDEAITGTPLYIPPESVTSPDKVDGRSDLYSLGAVAYFLLTGTPPFTGNTIVEICTHHLHSQPEPPSERRPELPLDLEAVILRCLQKDPQARYQTALQLRAALSACTVAATWNAQHAADWWERERTAFRAHCVAKRDKHAAASQLGDAATVPSSAIRIDIDQRLRSHH
jgi:serine/threonine-protein kinase